MPHFIFGDCIGCDACLPVCPTSAIRGDSGVGVTAKGFEGKGREIYVITQSLCIDCGVCGKYCPVESIQDDSGGRITNIKHKEMPKAFVIEENCTGCVWCVDICPFDCIVMARSSVERDHSQVAVVDQSTCVGCRLCVEICNKGAVVVNRHSSESDYMAPGMADFVVSPLRAY
jgi:formate hydrogenlyase subunit 6/NADH:ubiquinone oxidoreductase subunit I